MSDYWLRGRVTVSHAGERFSARIEWQHQQSGERIMLSSPLGQGLAELKSSSAGAHLQLADGQAHAAEHIEDLLHEHLGVAMPVNGMAGWILGRATDGTVHADAQDRPVRVSVQGWLISYDYQGDSPQALPERVVMKRADGTAILLKVDQWQTN